MGRTNIHRNTNPRPTTIPFLSSTSITSLLPYFLSAPNSSLLLLSGEEERYKFIMVEKKGFCKTEVAGHKCCISRRSTRTSDGGEDGRGGEGERGGGGD
ncbi:hypothetical protein M8J77_007603 [Diaphorina citri]|nr:hypothetical protein M8J77_007603 [Diaphorina citri]